MAASSWQLSQYSGEKEDMMRVRTGGLYRYNPNGWDFIRPCSGNMLSLGQVVVVINLPSAPRANTMGQCYVGKPNTKEFICMLSTGSLEKLTPEALKCYYKLRSKRPNSTILVTDMTDCRTEVQVER